jgi:hypothetical protein
MGKRKPFLVFVFLLFLSLACNVTNTPMQPIQTTATAPAFALPTKSNIPLNENEVPRVSVQEAKEAFDSQSAIFVDVRAKASYDAGHIPGAFSIQLGEFETNPTELGLPLDHWIIPYCA